MTPEQKKKSSQRMQDLWNDPVFRANQTRKLRKAAQRRKAQMATKPRKGTLMVIDGQEQPVIRVDEVTDGISVRLDEILATHKLAGLTESYKESDWYTRSIPVPTGYRISHVMLESAK